MTKTKKFKYVLPRKRLKKKKQRRTSDKRNIPNNLNPLTNANTQSRRVLNSNQCVNFNQNEPNDFRQKDDNIDEYFSCFEVIDNIQENELTNFSGDDPLNIPTPLNIDVNESYIEKEKIS